MKFLSSTADASTSFLKTTPAAVQQEPHNLSQTHSNVAPAVKPEEVLLDPPSTSPLTSSLMLAPPVITETPSRPISAPIVSNTFSPATSNSLFPLGSSRAPSEAGTQTEQVLKESKLAQREKGSRVGRTEEWRASRAVFERSGSSTLSTDAENDRMAANVDRGEGRRRHVHKIVPRKSVWTCCGRFPFLLHRWYHR